MPHPPIYQQYPMTSPPGSAPARCCRPLATRLAAYTVIDDVVVPPEYERYVIVVLRGDRVFQNPEDYVGYNADYTGFVPIGDHDNGDEHGGEQGYLGSTTST